MSEEKKGKISWRLLVYYDYRDKITVDGDLGMRTADCEGSSV